MAYEFVHFIPERPSAGTLYISTDYGTAVHLCGCGCGWEVVTPLSPAGWHIVFDGKSVSLYPSIGNWEFECQSHYWISSGLVVWVRSGRARGLSRLRWGSAASTRGTWSR